MKKMDAISHIGKVALVLYISLSMVSLDLAGLELAFAAEAEVGAVSNNHQQADKLLGLYFRRIDSFYEEGKFKEAKKELNKVYLIDPANVRAKEYESKIEGAQRLGLHAKEKDLAKREMMLGAHKVLQEKQEIKQAFDRMLEARGDNKDAIVDSYFDSTKASTVEYERLEKLGLKRYRDEVLKEARQYAKQKRYKLAVSRYRDILAIDPNDPLIRKEMEQTELRLSEEMDDFMLGVEQIDDAYLIREVTKKALASADYESAMAGKGFAESLKEPKPPIEMPMADKMVIPVTADFREVSLISVLNFLSDYTGINIIASQLVLEEDRMVTVRFKNLPLESALKYILKGQGLAYRVEEGIIWISTIEEMENEELETRVYYMQKGSGIFTQFSTSNFGSLGSTGASASVAGTSNIRDLIEDAVPFPPGAKIIFDQRLAALIVTNTPSNLQKIEQILYILDEPPQQILIESRFIDVSVDDDESFGIDMDLDETLLISDKLGVKRGKFGFLESSGYNFTGVSGTPSTTLGGASLAFAGILTDPQFQIFLDALDRNTKTKTLSAPKVTTVNNQTATIKVVTEEVFPTAFEVSLIQQDLNGDGDLDDAGETEFANVPQEFVSRDIGIILEVTPSVGMDHETITLSIIPEVSSVAATPATFTSTGFDSSNNEVRSGTGTPDLPRFTTSTLSTTVVLKSGETAVLGGLITESRGETHEKVPWLGDIPWLGKLFQSNQDDITRRNLIIFIKASVLN